MGDEVRKPTIVKTEVYSRIGMTIEVKHDDGTSSWLKSDVALNQHIEPAFPDEAMIGTVLNYQRLACLKGSEDQMDLLISKVREEAAKQGVVLE